MTVTDNAVDITESGVYLVSYYASGSVDTGEFIVSLYLNDLQVLNESIIQPNSSGAGSRTVLIDLDAGDSLALYNTSASAASLTDASITVLKLA
jgi:hypothetical protein